MALGLAREAVGNELPLRLAAELIDPSEAEQALQTLLNAAGFAVDTDGYAGPETIAALNAFLGPREPEITEGEVVDEHILNLLKQAAQ